MQVFPLWFKGGSCVYFHATSLNLQAFLKITQAVINFLSRDAYSIIIVAWNAKKLHVCTKGHKCVWPNLQLCHAFDPNSITSSIFINLSPSTTLIQLSNTNSIIKDLICANDQVSKIGQNLVMTITLHSCHFQLKHPFDPIIFASC